MSTPSPDPTSPPSSAGDAQPPPGPRAPSASQDAARLGGPLPGGDVGRATAFTQGAAVLFSQGQIASVIDALKKAATGQQESFNDLLPVYTGERLLARLARSAHAQDFVLQGGYLMRQLLPMGVRRATRDIDLLCTKPMTSSELVSVFQQIASSRDGADGVVFNPASVMAQPIRGQEGDGYRVKVDGQLGNVRLFAQADVGFGNIVIPDPSNLSMHSVHQRLPDVVLRAYPPSVVVAEKYQSIIRHDMANSRMKDFYDLAAMPQVLSFDGEQLVKSLTATFRSRQTDFPSTRPRPLTADFLEHPEKKTDWNRFTKSLPKGVIMTLAEAGDRAWQFLEAPTHATRNEQPFMKRWNASQQRWE